MSSFGDAFEEEFREQTAAYLLQHHPQYVEPLPSGALAQLIQSAIDRSQALGCDVGEPPARLAELMLFFGVDFESEQPWAKEIAAGGTSEPLVYIDRLYAVGLSLVETD